MLSRWFLVAGYLHAVCYDLGDGKHWTDLLKDLINCSQSINDQLH